MFSAPLSRRPNREAAAGNGCRRTRFEPCAAAVSPARAPGAITDAKPATGCLRFGLHGLAKSGDLLGRRVDTAPYQSSAAPGPLAPTCVSPCPVANATPRPVRPGELLRRTGASEAGARARQPGRLSPAEFPWVQPGNRHRYCFDGGPRAPRHVLNPSSRCPVTPSGAGRDRWACWRAAWRRQMSICHIGADRCVRSGQASMSRSVAAGAATRASEDRSGHRPRPERVAPSRQWFEECSGR